MLFNLSNLNSNLALTLGYLNPALNNSAQGCNFGLSVVQLLIKISMTKAKLRAFHETNQSGRVKFMTSSTSGLVKFI